MLMQACSLKQPSNKCSQNIAAFSAEQIPAAKAAVFLCYKNIYLLIKEEIRIVGDSSLRLLINTYPQI